MAQYSSMAEMVPLMCMDPLERMKSRMILFDRINLDMFEDDDKVLYSP